MIAAIVLAAGSATRFGGPKVLATLDDVPLVRHVVDRLALAGIEHVVATANAAVAPAVAEALAGTGAATRQVDDAVAGISASLRAGVDALPPGCTGFVVALADQPRIDPGLVTALRDTWRRTRAPAVVPVYRGVRGNPVFFDASMRDALRTLEGDTGARDLLRALGDRVATVPVDADVPLDVDAPPDLEVLRLSR